jgi:hypothetical protein
VRARRRDLICLLGLFGGFQWPALDPSLAVHVIESEKPSLVKGINVIDLAPTENGFCSVSNLPKLFWCNLFVGGYLYCGTGTNYIISDPSPYFAKLRRIGIPNIDTSPNGEPICRGRSKIFEWGVNSHKQLANIYVKIRRERGGICVDQLNRTTINEYVSPQLAFCSAFHCADRLFCRMSGSLSYPDRSLHMASVDLGSLPEPLGSPPQGSSEASNKYRRYDVDPLFMSVEPVGRGRDLGGPILFFASITAWLLWMGICDLLARRDIRKLDRDKGSDQDCREGNNNDRADRPPH